MQLGALIEKIGSGRLLLCGRERQSVNIRKVEELICSQENAPGTHKSQQKIEQITKIARSSVVMLTYFLAEYRPIAASLH